MTAIYKRELKAFADTMIGWIFVAAIMFITGIYFIAVNLMGGRASVASTISSSLFIYIIAIPLLTMRILTEERKQKIDQLIFTAPVSLWKIVCGKYLAMCTVLLMPVLVICTYPLVLSMYGSIAFTEAYLAIFGFFLYGMASIALCLFMSSLTESVVIAAVISFAAMFVTYMMQGLINIVQIKENLFTTALSKVLSTLDFGSYYDKLLNGSLDFRAIIYFVLIIVLFLFLTSQVIQKRRFTISHSTIKLGVYSTSMIVLAIALTIVANILVTKIPDKYMSIDVSNQKLYVITDTTRELLSKLDKDVSIYVLQSEDDKDDVIDKTLKQYADASKHISYEYKDPVSNPTFYKDYTDSDVSINSIIVVCGDKFKVIDASAMYEQEIDYSTYSVNTTGYDGEGQLTSAIDYVTMDVLPVAYNITGHGELKIGENFTDAISKMNVDLEDINLMNIDEISKDVQFVLISAPETDFSTDDRDKLLSYVRNGGKLYICSYVIQDVASSMPNFTAVLNEFGVNLIEGTLLEQDAKNYYQTPAYLLPTVNYSTLTNGIYNERYIFTPYSQGLKVTEDNDELTTEILLQSSDQALSYIDENTVSSEGPYNIGVYVTKNYGSASGSLMIFTSYYMLTDDADMMVSNANSTLFANCLSQYVDSKNGNISIPAKAFTTSQLTIDSGMGILYGIIFTILVPLALLIIGFVVWFRRRSK